MNEKDAQQYVNAVWSALRLSSDDYVRGFWAYVPSTKVITLLQFPVFRVEQYALSFTGVKGEILLAPRGTNVSVIFPITKEEARAHLDYLAAQRYSMLEREVKIIGALRTAFSAIQDVFFQKFQENLFRVLAAKANIKPASALIFNAASYHPAALATFIESRLSETAMVCTGTSWYTLTLNFSGYYEEVAPELDLTDWVLPTANHMGIFRPNRYVYIAPHPEYHEIAAVDSTASGFLSLAANIKNLNLRVAFKRFEHARFDYSDNAIPYLKALPDLIQMHGMRLSVMADVVGQCVTRNNDVTLVQTITPTDEQWDVAINLLRLETAVRIEGNTKRRFLELCGLESLTDFDVTIRRIAKDQRLITRNDKLEFTATRIVAPEWVIHERMIYLCGVPFFVFGEGVIQNPVSDEPVILYGKEGDKFARMDCIYRDYKSMATFVRLSKGDEYVKAIMNALVQIGEAPTDSKKLTKSLWGRIIYHACKNRLSIDDTRPLDQRLPENYMRLCCPQIGKYAPQYKLLDLYNVVVCVRPWETMMPAIEFTYPLQMQFTNPNDTLKFAATMLAKNNRSMLGETITLENMNPITFGALGPQCIVCLPVRDQPVSKVEVQTRIESRLRMAHISTDVVTGANLALSKLIVTRTTPVYISNGFKGDPLEEEKNDPNTFPWNRPEKISAHFMYSY